MISIRNLSLSFGGRLIFDNVNLEISDNDKIGLVGRNGAGKTTFLRLLLREISPDEGNIIMKKNLTLGYLPQHLDFEDTTSVWKEVISVFDFVHTLDQEAEKITQELANREDYDSADYHKLIERLEQVNIRLAELKSEGIDAKAERILLGLGFEKTDFDRPTSELSGGWRMRVELAKILLRRPDVLLFDESTNHLDIESIQWLEEYLKQFKGIIILVSHDRRFLDNVTTRTVEIVNGKIYHYPVSYSRFVVLRKQRIEQQKARLENQQRKVRQAERFIERFRYKATKASQVQSRIKMLEKQEEIVVDEIDEAKINFRFPPAPRSGDVVVEMRDLSKAYGQKLVLDRVSLIVERGEKLAFVGRNGEGKTTMARIIVGDLDYSGFFKLGHNVQIGYYAQNQDLLLPKDKTVLEVMEDSAIGEMKAQVRDILGSFLFSGDDVHKKVSVLSGGERARLALATLILRPYNLLVLDEPTNHLDILSKDILKQALKNYSGTLIVISHDRDFLQGLVDTVYHFRNHKIRQFKGGIDEFLNYFKVNSVRDLEETWAAQKNSDKQQKTAKASANKDIYLKRKQLQRQINRLEKKITETEQKIMYLEEKKEQLELKMNSPEKLSEEVFKEYANIKSELEQAETIWEQLHNELDQANDLLEKLN